MTDDQLRIIRTPVPLSVVIDIAQRRFGDMAKAAVDIRRRVMALGGELHSDEEAVLLEDGSAQRDIWGINLYPAETGDDWIEFDSMINVRPSVNNRSLGVEDPALRARIRRAVDSLVVR